MKSAWWVHSNGSAGVLFAVCLAAAAAAALAAAGLPGAFQAWSLITPIQQDS
jgi:hypothetical protein